MKAVQDFNYKVALASGLKHLQGRKLRQAEEQFRYLVSKFPTADGGYRGLARVQVEVGDRAAALGTLRDGAAALSRAGERTLAIDLLQEATTLDPLDLSAHRRLASAYALAGDIGAAAAEYVRFANAEIAAGDPDRARLEASYALETLGEIPALHDLARTVGLQLRTVRRLAPEPVTEAEVEAASPPGAQTEARIDEVEQPAWTEPAPSDQPPWHRQLEPAEDLRLAAAAAWAASRPASLQERPPELAMPSEEPVALVEQPVLAVEEAAPPAPAVAPAPAVDVFALEARAAELVARRDPDAGPVAVEAARALIDCGKVHAASDLLLQMVAAGVAVHEAERELIGVAHTLGRSEIAAEREHLLDVVSRLG